MTRVALENIFVMTAEARFLRVFSWGVRLVATGTTEYLMISTSLKSMWINREVVAIGQCGRIFGKLNQRFPTAVTGKTPVFCDRIRFAQRF
jgi:hypothetical protein